MKPDEFIAMLAPAARASTAKTGIPASFTLAQAALESGWGTSKTAAMARNLFNIKADKSWHGPVYQMASTEHVGGKDVVQPANWRMYPDWQACIDDRAKFFTENPRYVACFKERTGEGWARAVAAAGYATDPDYATKLAATMRSHCMALYDGLEPEPVIQTIAAPAPAPEMAKESSGLFGSIFKAIFAIFGKKGT